MAFALKNAESSDGQGLTASRLASIAEMQGLFRALREYKPDVVSHVLHQKAHRRKQHTESDEERPSTSLRKRMPMCRYQSLPEFDAGEHLLSQLAPGALPPHPALSSLLHDPQLQPSKVPKAGDTTKLWPFAPWGVDGVDVLEQASAPSRLPKLRARTAGSPGMTATTRQSMGQPLDVGSELRPNTSPCGRLVSMSQYEEACAKKSMLPKFGRTAQNSYYAGTLDLSGSGLGDQQLLALLHDADLVPLQQIRLWKLRDARLGDSVAAALAESFKDDVELVDLGCNKLSSEGVCSLANTISNRPLFKLRTLDLSGNAIGDDALGPLTESLKLCSSLLRLDLNSNYIRDGVKLGNFVASHAQLSRLSLRRNYLSGEGTAALFDGVLRNSKAGFQMADVDVAWNSIGSSNSASAAAAVAAVLRESATLYHCDLSYNGMDAAACAILSEGLRDNHSMYGLHVVGNAVTMDADGFLTPLDNGGMQQQMEGRENPRFGDLLAPTQSYVGASRCSSAPKLLKRDAEAGPDFGVARDGRWSVDEDLRGRDASERQSSCWACEGWERLELEWCVEPGHVEPRAVWAFTCLDAFRRGLRMQRQTRAPGELTRFAAARMVPPGWRLQVIYQVDTAIRLPTGCLEVNLNPAADIRLRACEELQILEPPYDQLDMVIEWDGPVPTMRVSKAGVVNRSRKNPHLSSAQGVRARRRSVVLDDPDGGAPLTMLRVTETEFKIQVKAARGRAFYADFRREDPSLHKSCFHMDWARCRLGRLLSETDLLAIMGLIEAEYGKLISVYRKFSGIDAVGDAELGVTQLQASEIIVSAGLGGDNATKIADIDRFFIAAKVTPPDLKKELVVINDKSMVRYEFLEFLVRIAHQRFYTRGVVDNMYDAISLALDAVGRQATAEATLMDEFFDALHTEAADDVYKKHLDVIDAVYRKHSGSKTLPGRPKTMVLGEFQRLLEVLDAYDSEFQPRLSGVAFRMGMMLQQDESGSTRFQEMSFVEFQHALGAVVFFKEGFSAAQMPRLLDAFFTTKLPNGVRQVATNSKRMSVRPPPGAA